MAEALAKKKKIRAGHRGSATRTVRQITETLDDETPDRDRLSLLRITLKEKLQNIKALDAEIVELVDDEGELANEIEQADANREALYASLLKVERFLDAAPPAPVPTGGATTHAYARVSGVKLPKIQLRSFNGEPTKWTAFWESFESAVHSNTALSDVEKFSYLNSLLERAAQEAVSGLALTAANYHRAIETLKKRFGCKQLIVNKHMDGLLHLESVTSSQNTRALRKLLDCVKSHIHSLQSLGVEPDSYSSLLCPVLVNKLPSELQLLISREVSEDDWKLNPLMEAIEAEVSARERISASQGHPSVRKNESRPPASATSLMTGGTATSSPCCYCGQLHRPSDCDVISQVDARKQALRCSGRCFSCLRKGHLSRDCRSQHRCHTCNGRHHSSICSPGPSNRQCPVQDGTIRNTTNPTTLNPNAPHFSSTTPTNSSGLTVEPSTTLSLYTDSNKTVLVHTESGTVVNQLFGS